MTHQVRVTRGEDAYLAAREALAGIELPELRGRRVLVKPNAARMLPWQAGGTTNPRAVAAVLDHLGERHPAALAVGESCITGVKAAAAFETTGIARVAQERGVPLLDLDQGPPLLVAVPGGRLVKELEVAAAWAEFDFVVSLAVMKTHMHTGVTLSVKNLKGLLWRKQKVAFHQLQAAPELTGGDKELDLAIADLAGAVYPHLALIDGSVGMEGLGPGAGRPKGAGLMVASREALAADFVACGLMGRDPLAVPHLRLAARARDFDPAAIRVAPEAWRDWAVAFAPPPRDLAFDYPGVRVHDRESCSACQNSLYLFLERYHPELVARLAPGEELHLALGRGAHEAPDRAVFVGKCALALPQARRDRRVPGCPPVASEIWETVRPLLAAREPRGA